MAQKPPAQKSIEVPAPTIGVDFAQLLHNDDNADITFRVIPEAAVDGSVDQGDSSMGDGEQCVKAHRLVLQVSCTIFHTDVVCRSLGCSGSGHPPAVSRPAKGLLNVPVPISAA